MKLFLFVCLFFTLNYGVMASSQQSFDIRQGSMNVEQESINLQECNSQKDRVARSMSLSILKKAMIPAQYLIAAVVVITLAFYIVRCLRSLNKKTSIRRLAEADGACGGGDGNGDQPGRDGDQPEGDGDQGATAAPLTRQERERRAAADLEQRMTAALMPHYDEANATTLTRQLVQRGLFMFRDGPPTSPLLFTFYNQARMFQYMIERNIMPTSQYIYNQFAFNTLLAEQIVEEARLTDELIRRIPDITDPTLRADAEQRVAQHRQREAQAIQPSQEAPTPWISPDFMWMRGIMRFVSAPIQLDPMTIEDIFARLSGRILEESEIQRLATRLDQMIRRASAFAEAERAQGAAATLSEEAIAAERAERAARAAARQPQPQPQPRDEEFEVPPGGKPGPDGEVE